jgi:hypothetical protein
MASSLVVRTGGQSGVDRAALDVAIAMGLSYAGWCPAGGWAEDFPVPPGLLDRYPMLTETPAKDPRQRTAWNVRDSDATLIVIPAGEFAESAGTSFTRVCAELVFVKPLHVSSLEDPASADSAIQWLRECLRLHETSLVLNVAGPRESESPGIYERSRRHLARVFDATLHDMSNKIDISFRPGRD